LSVVLANLNELTPGCDQAWLSSRQARTHSVDFDDYPHPETLCTDWSTIVIDCRLSYNWSRLWVLPINRSSSSLGSFLGRVTNIYRAREFDKRQPL